MFGLACKAAISVISVAELLGGARSQNEEQEIAGLIASFELYPFNIEIAELACA